MVSDEYDLKFKPTVVVSDLNSAGVTELLQPIIMITIRGGTGKVKSITIDYETLAKYLNTEVTPITTYTPQHAGSPATKEYVDDNIPTKVSDLTNDSNFQTATQVNQAISTAVSSAYKYKGSVANQAALPVSGNTTGDVWNTEDTGMNYAWTGSAWDALGTIVDLSGKQDKLIAGSNIQIASDGKTISATDTKYTAGTGISIDANNVISNTQTSAEWGNITGTLSDQTDLQTALDAKQDDMVILSYGNSTWNDFITAYQKNGVVYCRASSNSDPSTGSQGRLAFMAYVNNASNPTEVEFQYYRSRSSHSTAANVLDEVYVYKLVPTGGGTWSVTQRDTAAKPLAGTGIGLTYNTSGMTISADTSVLATKTDLNSKQDTISDLATIRSGAGLGATAVQPGDNISDLNNDSGFITNSYHDSTKQDKLIAGSNIQIASDGKTISATDTIYTAGDNVQISSSNVISATDTTYNAGTGIEIGNVSDYSAMQGPAPTGYHVPLSTEREAVYNIRTALGGGTSAGANFGTALKMPKAGLRYNSSSSAGLQGTNGNYWSSTAYSADSAYCLQFTNSGIRSQIAYKYAYGFPIRCFKDSPVIPDTSWTMLYGTSIDAGGIFWNSTDGLISMSSNGTTWITIQDKNLGATQVRNSGDTLSGSNCGGFFQWGNNYMFPAAGSVTTSSTQVDASSYGPGNYYNSSTFIIGNDNWSSVQNDNLRGGVTGIVTINNVIINTGVLSVNGQTGDITISVGDMLYSDFNWVTKSGTTITLDLNTLISSPSANFTVNAPATIKDGQTYVLRVANGATAYTMTLGTNVTNPYSVDTTLTASGVDQFVFLAVGGNLELQPETQSGGVTSVNGQTGDVTINEITFSEEAPANPSAGTGWFDYNDNFRIYSQDNSWKLINNVYKTYTPDVGDDIGYYSDLWNKIIVFSFNEDMSDRWIVTDLEYGDWSEQSQMYMSYKIIAIGQVADDAETTFISQRGLTRPKGIATLEITATNDGNGNFICSNVQFKETGGGGFELAPNSPLTPKYRRYGTQEQYEALTQYYTDEEGDTVYFTI